MVREYLDDDSTKDVSNKDYATINSMATLYLNQFDSSQHPIHTLAALESEVDTTADVPDNAQIASFSAASLCAAIAPSESPTIATISSTVPLVASADSLPRSSQERAIIAEESSHAARISAMTNQDDLDRRDPFRYQMFNSEINYVSYLDPDEEDVNLPSAPAGPPADLATLASPSLAPHDDFYLDPSLASNVARLPSPSEHHSDDDESSEALFSDEEPDLPGYVKTDRSGESTASSLLSIQDLLAKDNSFFLDDGDALMKVISSAIDFGAPSNLMTLYTRGNINKSQLLNFLRLESQHWHVPDPPIPGSSAKLPIDLSGTPSPPASTLKDPIIIDDSFDEPMSPVLAASTNHLSNDPPSHLRETSSSSPVASTPPPADLHPPLDNGFDGRNLHSFST
jgi:hypothetical protein